MPPERLFGRQAPLVFEIGFGSGSFLEHLGTEHPEWNLLGAETSLGSVRRTFRRLCRAGLRHVRLYPGSGVFLLRNVLPLRSLQCLYVNFPDPWPKKRHQDRRLLQAAFFELLSTRLEPGGTLLLTTDHTAYFKEALEEASTTGLFRIAQPDPPAAALKTKYARRWIGEGKAIHHATFQKEAEADCAFSPTIETFSTMHHAILAGELPPVKSFEKQVHTFEGGHVILLEAARRLGEEGLLIFGRIEEDELIQELIVEARPHERGVYVGIKRFGQPLTTRGTREAVRRVSEWLAAKGLEPVVEAF